MPTTPYPVALVLNKETSSIVDEYRMQLPTLNNVVILLTLYHVAKIVRVNGVEFKGCYSADVRDAIWYLWAHIVDAVIDGTIKSIV